MAASTRFDNALRYRSESHPQQTQLTPAYVLDPVCRDLGGVIGLDPCTTPENPVDAEEFFCPPVDGAAQPWLARSVFCNPPYGKAREPWVRRCAQAGAIGAKVVLLIPAATDTAVFQEALRTADSVVFIKGRVKFGVLRANKRQAAASHPSALIGWNTDLSASSTLGLRIHLRATPLPETDRSNEK